MSKIKTIKPDLQISIDEIQKRLIILRRLKGMWKNRKPNPLKELMKIRKG